MKKEAFDKASLGASLLALFSAVSLGALVPLVKATGESVPPLALAALLTLGGGVGAGVLWAARSLVGATAKRTASPQTRADAMKLGKVMERYANERGPQMRADAMKLAAMAVLSAASTACLMFGIVRTLAANASLLLGFQVAIATVLAWVFRRRHVCAKAVSAVCLMCVGSILLCWNVTPAVVFVPESLLVVAAGALWALQGQVERSIEGGHPARTVCVRELGAGIVLGVAAFARGDMAGLQVAPAAIAFTLGLVALGLGAVALLVARRKIGDARADGYYAFAPFAALLLSWGLFGFQVEPLLFGSLAFMALGVWLAADDGVFHEDTFGDSDRELVTFLCSRASDLSA